MVCSNIRYIMLEQKYSNRRDGHFELCSTVVGLIGLHTILRFFTLFSFLWQNSFPREKAGNLVRQVASDIPALYTMS